MKKIVILLIAILIAAALVTGGILAGHFLLPAEETETSSQSTPDIVGTWKGSKSIPLVGTIELDTVFSENGNVVITGKLASSTLNFEKSVDATWKQIDTTTYTISAYGYDINVKCNGKTLSYTLNPYKMGLTDISFADIDITITLTRT